MNSLGQSEVVLGTDGESAATGHKVVSSFRLTCQIPSPIAPIFSSFANQALIGSTCASGFSTGIGFVEFAQSPLSPPYA